jgi:GNAT superfamily N-acetyltransferase
VVAYSVSIKQDGGATIMTMSKVIFKDGSRVEIRRARPADAAHIAQREFESTSTGYFYLPEPQPTRSALERMVALRPDEGVTFVAETPAGEIIAYAFYHIVDSRLPVIAKPALYIDARYANSGISTILIQRLVQHGLLRGVDEFQMRIDASNDSIMNFIKRSGLPFEQQYAAGLREVRIILVHNAVQMHWLP